MSLVSRLAAFALLVLLLPLVAVAQPAKAPRVGILWHADSRESEGPVFDALVAGLRERGYVDGRTIVLEHRFAGETPERFRALAQELTALKPDVLVGVSPPSAAALKATGTNIPIVFTAVDDPVASGLVQSLARPGGNATGFTLLAGEMTAKRLELLLEVVPDTRLVGVLYNPDGPLNERLQREIESAGRALGANAVVKGARNGAEIDAVFREFRSAGVRGVLVVPDGLFWFERKRIANAAIAAGIAETQFSREGAEAGSLFSYGPNIPGIVRQTADYVARILRGARPQDLPVVEPTRFELVINLKTAKALNRVVPPSVLVRADELIK